MYNFRRHFLAVFTLFCVIILFSCSEEKEQRGEISGMEYYPISLNKSWVYQSDSIVYNKQTSSVDTFQSLIKEEVVDSFLNPQGETVFIIERFFKRAENDQWEVSDVWSSVVNNTEIRKTEENLTFVKLIFPITDNSRWDGNVYIDDNTEVNVGGETLTPYKYWDYRVESTNDIYQNETLLFNEVLSVSQARDSSEIELRFATEKYVKDVGLVYKIHRILESQCTNCPGQTWEEKAEKGYIHTLKLISYN